jgi:hypothetical protein
MKLAKLVLFSVMCGSLSAQALTFCTNAVKSNKGRGGANWMFLFHDKCPTTTQRIPSMSKFGYVLESKGEKDCVYRSSRTDKTGDKLICETKLSREDAAKKIRASGITSSGLQRIAGRLETPVEELEFHDEEEALNNPPALPGPVQAPAPQPTPQAPPVPQPPPADVLR